MAAPGEPRGGGIIAGINVTPLVDITLVLLIIFIVTAKIIVAPAVPLDLPRATQSEQIQVIFSVIVPDVGPTLVNGQAVTSDQALFGLASAALQGDSELRAASRCCSSSCSPAGAIRQAPSCAARFSTESWISSCSSAAFATPR